MFTEFLAADWIANSLVRRNRMELNFFDLCVV